MTHLITLKKVVTALSLLTLSASFSFAEITYPIVSTQLKPVKNNIELIAGNKPVSPGDQAYIDKIPEFVIVGDDIDTMKWLKKYKTLLEKGRNVYYVIANVKNQDNVDTIKKLLPRNVKVVPMNADWLSDRYKIKKYPDTHTLNPKDKTDVDTLNRFRAVLGEPPLTKKELSQLNYYQSVP